MTLIERLAGVQPFEDYEFHARRRFCQPSEKTLAFAKKVFDRLKKEFDAGLEAWCERNSGTNGKVRLFWEV